MPPRKEPKETVVYPASKRKPPPFKPQRPSKVPRIPTTESESTRHIQKKKSTTPVQRKPTARKDRNEEIEEDRRSEIDLDEDLDDHPLASKPTKPTKAKAAPASKRNPSIQLSPLSDSSQNSSDLLPDRPPSAPPDQPPVPSQTDPIPSIPQPLLIRLLHGNFADSKTKIDQNAIQVLQKYFEVFVRETIARAKLQKQEDAENAGGGGGSQVDTSWLELDDLEKVAAGMLLDF